MKNTSFAVLGLLGSTSAALAGGLDRSGQDVSIIFEQGSYFQLTYGNVNPSVSGVHSLAGPSGDVAPSYTQIGIGYKQSISDKLDFALIIDQPFGASIDYPTGTTYPLMGTNAVLNSTATTIVAKYQMSERVSLLAGLRNQSIDGDIAITGGYTLTAEDTNGLGYVIGAAYEIPDIALRVALTYNSAIDHTMQGMELGAPSSFDIRTPQSVNLTAQSGIAADTLLFGSIRWVDWDAFDITPNSYPGGALVSYDNDVVTYSLGVGRRFSDNFSGSIAVGYERSTGTPASNLSPTDGYMSVQIGGRYTMDNITISGGVRYIDIGDTTTEAPVAGVFADNSAIALGLSVGIGF